MRKPWIAAVGIVVLSACTGGSGGVPSGAATEGPTTGSPPATATASSDLGSLDPKAVIAYQSAAGGSWSRVFVAHADGTDDRDLAPDLPGGVQHPDFSRDGRSVAFDQRDDDTSNDQVYVANADGSEPKILVPCDGARCLQRWEPAWSPTGDQLAISTTDGTRANQVFGIAVVDTETGRLTQLVSSPRMQAHYPRWSPDGTQLVFWFGRDATDGSIDTAIFVVNADGTGLRQLTPWSLDAANPDWAPDRDELVFSVHSIIDPPGDEPARLFTMRPDGSRMEPVSTVDPPEAQATQPRWTPDGRAIVYSHVPIGAISPRHLWVIDADGTDDRPVFVTWNDYLHPTMQP